MNITTLNNTQLAKKTNYSRIFIVLIIILFVNSGVIKWIWSGYLDLTIIFTVILGIFMIKELFNKRIVIDIASKTFLLFFFWLSFTCLYTISDQYYLEKYFHFIVVIVCYFLPLIVLKEDDERIINHGYYYLGIFTLILVLVIYVFYFDIFITYIYKPDANQFGDLYLAVPDYLSIASVLGIFVILNIDKKSYINYLIMALAIIIILGLGSRGGFYSLIIVLFARVMFNKSKIKNGLLLLIIIGVVFIILIYFMDSVRIFDRFNNLFESNSSSVLDRIFYLQKAFDIFSNNFFFGVGFGGFGKVALSQDIRAYPHNILLEISSETGIIGLLIFVLFLFLWNKKIRKKLKTNKYLEKYYWIVAYLFLESMKSSSLIDIKQLSFFLGITVLFYTRKEFSRKKSIHYQSQTNIKNENFAHIK